MMNHVMVRPTTSLLSFSKKDFFLLSHNARLFGLLSVKDEFLNSSSGPVFVPDCRGGALEQRRRRKEIGEW
jgi:hypothetical protein